MIFLGSFKLLYGHTADTYALTFLAVIVGHDFVKSRLTSGQKRALKHWYLKILTLCA